ncbi:MAG: sigma 54-interacting transcriptional regulator [Pyrinomonadaceae bacterium]|nr:sigma 54-interacting transcriptional regulator [Pyrinomonadaceae bacterium]
MNPRLVAISGHLKGLTFALAEDEILIGRETSNSICLNELSVSRRHCRINRESSALQDNAGTALPPANALNKESNAPAEEACQFQIVDLESFNGTFVNGVPIKQYWLEHGDQIAVGDVVLLFLVHEAVPVGRPMIQSDEGSLITRSTVRLRREDALYLRPENVFAELPDWSGHLAGSNSTARIARNLNALLKISTAIISTRELPQLQMELFKVLQDVIPAERAAFLMLDRIQDLFGSVCGWSKLKGRDDSIRVSQTVTNQVLREGVALLSNDLFESSDLGQKASLAEARVCSVLCAPLAGFEKPLGVIYLDTSDPTSRFDEDHLQLLTAIAGIATAPFENARQLEWLEDENRRLQEEIHVEHQMIGESAAMRAVYQFIGKVAAADSTVLIRGESGTGKELAARAVHQNSARATKPFIAINGATLSEALLESELFGHEKGAFTSAILQKRGKLEVADGGTLFLDEVGELTASIQAKLLRVLQEREFERVGGTRTIKVDVRIVAATNKNLEEAVANGTFRQDLYYRLNVVSVTMPPLRNRREDIQLLASYFSAAQSKKCRRKINGISPEARTLLRGYDWPGNVRELENAIEHALVLGTTEMIVPEDLPEAIFETEGTNALPAGGYHEELKKAKQSIVVKAIETAGGHYAEAARQLGLHPNNLHRLIRNLNLKTTLKK